MTHCKTSLVTWIYSFRSYREGTEHACKIKEVDFMQHSCMRHAESAATFVNFNSFSGVACPITRTSCCVQASLSLGQSWRIQVGSFCPQQTLRRHISQTEITRPRRAKKTLMIRAQQALRRAETLSIQMTGGACEYPNKQIRMSWWLICLNWSSLMTVTASRYSVSRHPVTRQPESRHP